MNVTTHNGTTPVWTQRPRPYGVAPGAVLTRRSIGADGTWSLDTVARVMLEPRSFFRARCGRSDIASAAAFAMTHAAVVTAVAYAAVLVGSATRSPVAPTALYAVRSLSACSMWSVAVALAALVGTFALACVFHPLVRVLGGRGGIGATYDACVYGLAPLGVMIAAAYGAGELGFDRFGASAWMIVVGCAWSVALIFIAIAEEHPLADWASFLATCVPAAALLSVAVPVLSVQGNQPLPHRVATVWRTVKCTDAWGLRGHRASSTPHKHPNGQAARKAALQASARSHGRPRG